MARYDRKTLEMARLAMERIEQGYLFHPLVSAIDIGPDPSSESSSGQGRLAVRVHLRRPADPGQIDLPDDVDGVPVRIIIADYEPE